MSDTARRACEDPHSQATIETDPPERLKHWSRELGVTTEALQAAVHAVGPRVDKVKDYLTGGQAGNQSDG